MKLCRFSQEGVPRLGRVEGGHIVDLSPLCPGASMRRLIADLDVLRADLAALSGPPIPLAAVTLLAPIDDPQKFLAIGMNYKEHAREAEASGVPIPTSQLWFNKQVSCINGPHGDIELPRVSKYVDYEAELAFVIGRRCHDVPPEAALSVIAGYLICNDVSARDWQKRSPTFTLGKSFDSHGPIGPWITTADEIPDPQALDMRLWVNGEERQHISTADMIYPIREQIAYLSQVMTLEPGDLISTGTPQGVGMATKRFLSHGDVVRIAIENLGHIENRCVAEP